MQNKYLKYSQNSLMTSIHIQYTSTKINFVNILQNVERLNIYSFIDTTNKSDLDERSLSSRCFLRSTNVFSNISRYLTSRALENTEHFVAQYRITFN